MLDNRPLMRPHTRAGAAIAFAALAVLVVVIAPGLLWPVLAAAGIALVLVAWRAPNLARVPRVVFAVVGLALLALAVIPPLDLFFSAGTTT